MEKEIKKWIRPVLFTLAGALIGYMYYRFIGCSTGSCVITSNPVNSTIYMGIMGYLISMIFSK